MAGSPPGNGWRVLQRQGVAFVVLVLSLVVTAFAWHTTRLYVMERSTASFNGDVDDVVSTLRDRMAQYEQILWGGTGFFASGAAVERRAWRRFVDAQRIRERFPGVLGVGFSLRVPKAELARHIASVRAEGFPNYTVWPAGDRQEYHTIVYLEPFSGRNLRAFGYDMFTNPVRRTAMERARDTGLAAVSGKVVLVQETRQDQQAGFLMYVPVYATGMPHATLVERRAALLGFVYSPFRVNDMMAAMFGQAVRSVDFWIYDGAQATDATLLYDSRPASGAAKRSRPPSGLTRPLDLGGHQWTIWFRQPSSFAAGAGGVESLLVLAGGTVISLLLFGMTWSLATTRERAVQIAEDMVDQLRRSEEALRESHGALRRRAEELARSNEELEQFAYVASHDLQEPLRTVTSYVQLLAKRYMGQLDAKADAYIQHAVAGAHRMHRLINDLLQYSRARSKPLEFAPTDCAAVLHQVLVDLKAPIEGQRAVITHDPLPILAADAGQIHQLLLNLVGNAIKFHKMGDAPRVHVSVQDQGSHWLFSVRDHGIGIDPKDSRRIFEMFERLHSHREYSGTGVGLAICTRIVERHGGRIWVESAAGMGCTFYFTIGKRALIDGAQPKESVRV